MRMAAWYWNAWVYGPIALLVIVGLLMVFRGLFADRASGRRRCPNCWYDMQGVPGLRCPECGRTARSERDLARTRRHLLPIAVGIPLIAVLPAYFAARGDLRRAYYALPPRWVTVESERLGPATCTRLRLRNPDDRGERVVIRTAHGAAMEFEDVRVELGQRKWDPTLPGPPRLGAGDDLDHDGTPDLVVFQFSGGAHCCYTVHVLELSDPPRLVATIDALNGMALRQIQDSQAGAPEVLLNVSDQSFDYWNGPHAGSPFPSVWYRLRNHRLEIALDFMLQHPQAAERGASQAASDRVRATMARPGSSLNQELWARMLDLLYSGEDDAAWRFLDAAWPEQRPGKDAFKREFLKVLEESPQWQDFREARQAFTRGLPPPPARIGSPSHPRSNKP